MDDKVKWDHAPPEEESLVDAVNNCVHNLIMIATMKHGRVTTVSSDAFASSKVIELLQLGNRWKPCLDFTDEDLRVPTYRRQKKMTELVADFGKFKLHRNEVMNETDVRVVVAFEVEGSSAKQEFFGNVELSRCNE